MVVVDIIVDDDVLLRQLAGLAGPHDDADEVVVECFPNVTNGVQAGVVGFHDDIENEYGRVGVRLQQPAGVRAGVAVNQQ